LATAIAETSLTVDGVRIVVDAGRSRFLQYDQARGMGRLVTATASKASAEQRAGRAGRLSEGVAWRVWDEGLHYQRRDFDRPEIMTADLSAFVLELATWGASVDDLAWLDRPPPESVATAVTLLGQLGLLDEAGRVTKRGRQVGALPVHPRLGAIVVEAQRQGLGWLGCLAAAALEERDVLRGRPWELPVDLGERVSLLGDPARHHPAAAKGTLQTVRRRAVQLADRASVAKGDRGVPVTDELGALLAVGYPDRVGQRRSTRGKYLLSSGSGASVASRDPVASEPYIVVADLDVREGEAQVRIGAGVDRDRIVAVLGDAMKHDRSLSWDVSRDGLIVSERRMLGALVMREVSERPGAGDEVVSHVIGHVRTGGLGVLGWSSAASELRDRVGFAHAAGDSSWPAMDEASLLDELESWLAPHLGGVVDGDDLRRVDLHEALWGWLGWHRRRDLDRLLPRRVTLAGGRQLSVDYGRDRPTVRSRVQDFYGMVEGPTIVDGRYPLTLELLSPAGRPVQVTADLAGFWAGSWVEVRKEMAGRYPKHRWPIDPSAG
jgi:ATP-dependent helicase HrpB